MCTYHSNVFIYSEDSCISFVCSGNENTGHPPDARGNTSFDISTPVAQIDIPNSTVSMETILNQPFAVN